jgi:hypothetical protein
VTISSIRRNEYKCVSTTFWPSTGALTASNSLALAMDLARERRVRKAVSTKANRPFFQFGCRSEVCGRKGTWKKRVTSRNPLTNLGPTWVTYLKVFLLGDRFVLSAQVRSLGRVAPILARYRWTGRAVRFPLGLVFLYPCLSSLCSR